MGKMSLQSYKDGAKVVKIIGLCKFYSIISSKVLIFALSYGPYTLI